MFRPAPMLRLSLVVLERDRRAVLRYLAESGAVQLVRTIAGPETAPLAPRDRGAEVSQCARLLAGVEELRRALELAPFPENLAAPPEMTQDEAEQELAELEQRAQALLKRRQDLLQHSMRLATDFEQVANYRELDFPLNDPQQHSFLQFMTGRLPVGNFEALQKQIGGPVAFFPLVEAEGKLRLMAMTTRTGRPALESALETAGFEAEPLPVRDDLSTDSLAQASQLEQQSVLKRLQEANEELRNLASDRAVRLAQLAAFESVEHHLLETEQSLPRTETAVLITGWIPATETEKLERGIREITGDHCVFSTATPDHDLREEAPVLLRHPRLLRPFEMLVEAYGSPSYEEFEPTLFVAISYVFMFGMMFGDIGHGAVLATAGFAGLLAGRSEKLRDAGLLLVFGGLSSMAFGAVYGSCFGLETFKRFALWRDPLEGNPMTLMYCAVGIGIAMISLGLILNILNRLRRGDVLGGFLDKFGVLGALFYWGVLLLITKFTALESQGLVGPALVLFLAVPMLGWMLKEPLEYWRHRRAGRTAEPGGSLGTAIIESLVGVFEAVLSYLANTISFVRLAAYAMSHAALLVAAFMLADAVRHFPAAGGALSVMVVILGNLIAIVLEGIIASVQALRLEYYEFFGKFFLGNGHPFKPFRLAWPATAT